ncbi:uncharacterized protein LOC125618745 [Marmota marmota marmota]|uniref:uncharacterized protein LOC125618745 n=1 Tax=Marmota marmota marmota TaxID=9994 RepID=UPI002093B3AE|nr:uncharacterized protein LOC125618745 [Marmota marmota marmota]
MSIFGLSRLKEKQDATSEMCQSLTRWLSFPGVGGALVSEGRLGAKYCRNHRASSRIILGRVSTFAGLVPQAVGRSVADGVLWGGAEGISGRGLLAGKLGCAGRRERDRYCRVPLSSLRDPVQAGSRLPEPEAVVGKPLALPRSPASQPRFRSARSSPPPASLQALHLLRRPGPLHARLREETMEVVPARNRVEMPTSPSLHGEGQQRRRRPSRQSCAREDKN